jgi:hypothetical protein
MGLFGWLRGKDVDAIPKPGTPEFEAAVRGSALPDAQSVSMGQPGWTSPGAEAEQTGDAQAGQPSQTIDLRGSGARQEVEEVLREHGIDPDKEGQTIDASSKPGLREALLKALFTGGVDIPNAGGFGGGISTPKQDPIAVVEELARRRDAGEISDAEFEAQKKRLLGS